MGTNKEKNDPLKSEARPVVALLTGYYATNSGYIETVLAERLSEFFDVHVITSTLPIRNIPAPGLDAKSKVSGPIITRIKPVLSARGRIVAFGASDHLDQIEPDLVIQLSPSQLFSLPATNWARRHKIPLIYVSGENSEQLPPHPIGRILARLYNGLVRRKLIAYAARRADLVFAITPETKLELEAAHRDIRPTLLNLPVDTSIFYFDTSQRAEERSIQGWTGHVTIFTGKFEERKNLREVAEGWMQSAGRVPDSKLVMVGLSGAPSESRYVQEISELSKSIELRKFVAADELSRLLQASDLGIFPTPTIGIQQAMATGLPVVLSETPAVAHLIAKGSDEGVHVFETRTVDGHHLNYIIPEDAREISSDLSRVVRVRKSKDPTEPVVKSVRELLEIRET